MKQFSKLLVLVMALCLWLNITAVMAQDGVTLTESETTWKTLAYELDADNGVVPGSLDTTKTVEHTFKTYILENEFLKVTLLPEYGGRILSIIYKPTGHEQLYQNPLGVPYGIGAGNFYYDWLMVYGGIFPTFPEPEHGKAWLVPWDFQVITETPDEVTVAMTFTDNIDFARAPGKFDTGATGIEATYTITLLKGRAALDTQVKLHNPGDKPVKYEYWTCTTLAPGSEPGSPRATAGAEIIAPVDVIKMPPWWPATLAQEKSIAPDVYTFDKLRQFKNWADMGIAYAYPNMNGANFWGVINHDNQEGIIRIASNDVSSGMKMWTWGYDSVDVDPLASPPSESRPYIELWAGVTSEFFKRTSLPANGEVVINETYMPTTELTNVTQASGDLLANFYADDTGQAHVQLFNGGTAASYQVVLSSTGGLNSETTVDMATGDVETISVDIPAGTDAISLTINASDNTSVLSGQLKLE